MEVFVVSLLNGLVYGMLLFMLASGLTLILSMMGVLNSPMPAPTCWALFRLHDQPIVWPALVIAPCCAGWSARDRDVGAAAGAPNDHIASAVHFRPRPDHREGRADDLGPAAGAVPVPELLNFRSFASTARNSRPIAPSCW
jgi:hypothetical protein